MDARQTIHIGPLLDDMKINRTHIGIFILCFVTLFVDGMDFAAMIVAAPSILRDWQLDPKAIGTIFGAGNLGMLTGALIFGRLGDIYGRRNCIIGGVLAYSLPALATTFANSFEHLLILRFLTCIGIGGVLPLVISLITEGAPKRLRGSSVLLAQIGYSLGPGTIGAVAALLIPRAGWPSIFIVVGTIGLLLSVLLYFILPESVRFLALKKPQSDELRQTLRRLAPDVAVGPQTQFILDAEPAKARVALADLFQGRLATITPLLWAIYFTEALTFITLASWIPVLVERGGASPAHASLAFAYAGFCGLAAQLLLARVIDSLGWLATLAAVIITTLALLSLSMADLTTTMVVSLIVIAMSFAVAAHNSLNGLVASFYPTAIRSNGVGLASGAGRVGAIVGPIIGGHLMSELSLGGMSIAMAIPYIVTAILCLIFYALRARPVSGANERAPAQEHTPA
ncbi:MULTISPECIES: MFS transporter [unclassified Beijerinckia]|uniref:MFS transporter n=1 Tax=unclassified Beijerinckia TaxID=2638183 RepID=UPI00089C1715|nr:MULTISPECIES: MFS transporter [unclassified Beijerinckia]MDH7798261.1 AAHS family 4-hydroxybenzoate transporter-like MFS transporter [Beijerinckia sp. GAS462]SED14821.1 MFS transporter, AAHS family, 4-hydroxybenzoate transporter [Beijerinckia sp. 28-YEA-48]